MARNNGIAFLLLVGTVFCVRAFIPPGGVPEVPPSPYSFLCQPGNDMLLLDGQLENEKSGITNKNEMWPEGVVAYAWDKQWNEITGEDWIKYTKNQIFKAMDAISAVTCIRFREARLNEFAVTIKLHWDETCNAHVGRAFVDRGNNGTELNLSVKNWCSGDPGIILHELLHTIGFWHEQQRPDRDEYVTIHWDNMDGDRNLSYGIQPDSAIYGTPYDYKSIMHYYPDAFAKPGTKAFTPNPKYYEWFFLHRSNLLSHQVGCHED